MEQKKDDASSLNNRGLPSKTAYPYGIMVSIVVGCLLIAASIFFGARYVANKLTSVQSANQSGSVVDNKTYDIKLADGASYLGSANAKATIVEFGDYQCPFCEKFFSQVLPDLKSKYIDTGKVKFYFQNYAFLGDESVGAAEAAACAQAQNKFWNYYDALYTNQKAENSGGFSNANLKLLAKNLKLDVGTFNKCLDSGIKKDQVLKETSDAGQNYGVNSTPTVFINGHKMIGVQPASAYEVAIDATLKK